MKCLLYKCTTCRNVHRKWNGNKIIIMKKNDIKTSQKEYRIQGKLIYMFIDIILRMYNNDVTYDSIGDT